MKNDIDKYLERITIDSKVCGGRPCIRGMRIRVSDILDLLASGQNHQEVLSELPDLQIADIQAAIKYAAARMNSPILVA